MFLVYIQCPQYSLPKTTLHITQFQTLHRQTQFVMQRRLPILPLLRSRTVLTEQLCNSACISCHTCARISFPDSAYGSRENSPTTNLTSGLSTDTESSEVGEPPVTSSPAPQHSPKFCVEPRTPINFNNDEPSYQTLDNSTPLDGDFSKLSCYGAIGDGQPRAQIPEMATAGMPAHKCTGKEKKSTLESFRPLIHNSIRE